MLPRCESQFLGELPDEVISWENFDEDSNGSLRSGKSFIPLDDHLPPEETAWKPRRGSARRRREIEDEPVFSIDDPTGASRLMDGDSPYAGWLPGTLVTHDTFGVGRVEWIRPGGGQTRASIRFAGHGEKTFILELAPVRKLERGNI